jgi:hypothetical protein
MTSAGHMVDVWMVLADAIVSKVSEEIIQEAGKAQ